MTMLLRETMTRLHSWAGVVLGALIFAIFWMGSLSVFDKEIDQWMKPTTRLDAPQNVSLDVLRPDIEKQFGPLTSWGVFLPGVRTPTGGFDGLFYTTRDGESGVRPVDFARGELLPDPQTLAGTRFIFPFHYSLHIRWQNLGYWLLGLGGMAMLVLLMSGVIIHRKLFAEFFTFRRRSKLPRSSLDLHHLTGVLGLPFHLLVTFSGLVVFFHIYFPQTAQWVYAQEAEPQAAFSQEAFGRFHREPANQPAPGQASLDAMLSRAQTAWDGSKAWIVTVHHPGDENGYVQIRRQYPESVTRGQDTIWFDAVTGEELHRFSEVPVNAVQSWFLGLHFIQFNHWPLRWLYFLLGLTGCTMIATGYIYWLEARRKRHAQQGLAGFRVIKGLTIGAVTGLIIATLAFFAANRLLPLGVSFAGYDRAALEVWAFYLAWIASFAHAWLRPNQAWREQCWAIAALALLAPVLNGLTTGDHLLKTLMASYWPVAGMDALLLSGATIAALTTRRLAPTRSHHMSREVAHD